MRSVRVHTALLGDGVDNVTVVGQVVNVKDGPMGHYWQLLICRRETRPQDSVYGLLITLLERLFFLLLLL